MPLRFFMVLILLMSHAMVNRLVLGDSGSGSRVQTADAVPCCPLCGTGEGAESPKIGCGCGCGVSETPMPAAPDGTVLILVGGERYEPVETEITAIVAVVVPEYVGVVGACDEHTDMRGGVTEFLATTGHWII